VLILFAYGVGPVACVSQAAWLPGLPLVAVALVRSRSAGRRLGVGEDAQPAPRANSPWPESSGPPRHCEKRSDEATSRGLGPRSGPRLRRCASRN